MCEGVRSAILLRKDGKNRSVPIVLTKETDNTQH